MTLIEALFRGEGAAWAQMADGRRVYMENSRTDYIVAIQDDHGKDQRWRVAEPEGALATLPPGLDWRPGPGPRE